MSIPQPTIRPSCCCRRRNRRTSVSRPKRWPRRSARRGIVVDLATDDRAERYGKSFRRGASTSSRARPCAAAIRSRWRAPRRCSAFGTLQAWRLLGRIRPAAVVGFGGYPTVPPVLAATLRGIPTLIHEQNAVMGRANRLLAPRVSAIATSFAGVLDREPALAAKATCTGNPVRPAVIAAAATPYAVAGTGGPLRLLVFGGSQGARIMADIVPAAIERLEPHLQIAAARSCSRRARRTSAGSREIYARAEGRGRGRAVLHRSAGADRGGASRGRRAPALRPWRNSRRSAGRPSWCRCRMRSTRTRPPMPACWKRRAAAIRLRQDDFTPDRLAAEISALASAPQKLVAMAAAAPLAGRARRRRAAGRPG